ncbi:carbohydrate ABC transporter permease [Paenibacillus dakarensis]|uniref:carbohydrate ABC transporter permease n=1 Tax=Paenibacillus dakarensis TaxID=1527293 RepID=UPI0006D559BB|nr:sugar ABC transporter permease [Paenibacillus dakarensis]
MSAILMKKLKSNSGILYILPSFLLILIFSLIPLVMTGYYSFTQYNVIQQPEWIGLDNYAALMNDAFFKTGLTNTLIYTVIVVPVQTIISLMLANVIATYFRNRLGTFFRSALFIPVISSMILVGTIWKFMLATENGFINLFLGFMGLDGLNWLGSKTLALISICLVSIWKNVGYFLVIYYAGIMDIPRSHYEAAQVDGATRFQQFHYITVPSLKAITYLVITLGTIWSFQVFDLVYAMTGGGPGKSTLTMVLNIYQSAFKQYKMGYGSAISFILFILILMISGVQKRFFRDKDIHPGGDHR